MLYLALFGQVGFVVGFLPAKSSAKRHRAAHLKGMIIVYRTSAAEPFEGSWVELEGPGVGVDPYNCWVAELRGFGALPVCCLAPELEEVLRLAEAVGAALEAVRGGPVPAVEFARLVSFERGPHPLGRQVRVVCARCEDTHWVDVDHGRWMCTSCPRPCQKCRAGGVGAFCGTTPCACECHQ